MVIQQDRFVVILLDDLRTSATLAWRVKEIARRFAKLMGSGDVVTVIKLNGDRAVTSTNRDEVLAAIDRFKPGGASTMQPRFEADHAMGTISELARQMAESPHPRKVLVCIGAPLLFSPHAYDPSTGREAEPEAEYSRSWFDALGWRHGPLRRKVDARFDPRRTWAPRREVLETSARFAI